MAQLTMSRRSFIAAVAATGAACAVSASVTEPMKALAETSTTTTGDVKHVRTCCRACGKVECGVWVTVMDGKAIKVEGDESAPQSRGHCCAKSQSSMQAAYHPDRLRYPVKRTNPKGVEDPGWVRITLDEAFELVAKGLGECVDKYGGQSIVVMCGTSRVWSLGPYQGMKQLFGTPNAHLAYQVCKGPRHWAGIMTDEMGSPWMEVEAEPKVYLQWGTAVEYSNYDTTNRTISDVRAHADYHIVVDPRMTPISKEADCWLNLRPSTDGALALGMINWIIENEAYDDTMVRRWSNATFLYCDDKPWLTTARRWEGNGGIDMRTKLITEADVKEGGSVHRFMVWDENNQRLTWWDSQVCKWEGETSKIPTTGSFIKHPLTGLVADCWLPDESTWADPADSAYDKYWDEGNEKGATTNPMGLPKKPALFPGEIEVELIDGKKYKCRTVWDGFHDLTSQYSPEKVTEVTGVEWAKVEEACKHYTTRIDPRHGNGGVHFQLATDQNGNSIQNCRALQILSCITGNSDEPAGNRGSCKSQFDGNPGRSNMQKSSEIPEAQRITWDGRDYSLDDVAKYMQDFVQYLIDENSPLAERYGNHVPTDDEAIIIAKRMGGAMNNSKYYPNPKSIFTRQAGMVDADRFPLNRFWARWCDANTVWDACLQDPDWTKAQVMNDVLHNEPFDMHVKPTLYAIHGGVCQSGDVMNMANTVRAWNAMAQMDFFTEINLWFMPTNGNADVIFPCQHWMEVDSTRVSQGAGGMFGCCCKAIEAPGDTIYDPDWNCGMYRAMGVPWNTKDPDAAPSKEEYILKPKVSSQNEHRQVDRLDRRGVHPGAGRQPELSVARPRPHPQGQRRRLEDREVPERPDLGRGQGMVHRARLDGLPRVASRALGHLSSSRDGLATSAGRLQPVRAGGPQARLHHGLLAHRDLVTDLRSLHLQRRRRGHVVRRQGVQGERLQGRRSLGAHRHRGVPGRRRPLPDLSRGNRLAGAHARAVPGRQDRRGSGRLLPEPVVQRRHQEVPRQRVPADHRFASARVLPLRASPAAVVPRAVARSAR